MIRFHLLIYMLMIRSARQVIRLNIICAAVVCLVLGPLPAVAEVDSEIRAYIQKLKDPDPGVRHTASEMLGTLGPRAINDLLKEVLENPRSGDPERLAAIDALGMMGPGARRAIPVLVRTLGSQGAGGTHLKVAAARTLGKIGPESQEVIPALKQALERARKDEDISICRAVGGALWDIGPAGADAVNELIALLKNPTESMRHLAADALGKIGLKPTLTLPPLTSLLKQDASASVRRAAANALRQVGRTALDDPDDQEQVRRAAADSVEQLIAALSDPDPEVRRAAADALAEFGPALAERGPAVRGAELTSEAIVELTQQLKREPPQVAVSAAIALSRMGPMAKASVRELNDLLVTPNWELRRIAADALARIGPDDDSITYLIRRLDDPQPEVKQSAADALAQVGPRAAGAVSGLRNLLKDPAPDHWTVRRSAADALGQIGRKARDAVQDLCQVLMDARQDLLVRRSAAVALGLIGDADENGLNELANLVRNKHPMLRRAATVALWQIGPQDSLAPAFIELLDDPDREVRRAAIDALAQIGPEAKAAVPQLTRLLTVENSPTWEIRRSAADALRTILQAEHAIRSKDVEEEKKRVAARDAAEMGLVQALNDLHWEVRRSAAYALLGIKPSSKASIGLVKALRDGDWVVRRAVGDALAKIDDHPPVQRIIEVLGDPDKNPKPEWSVSAAEALRQMKSKAGPALPALARMLARGRKEVWEKASHAIVEICGDRSYPAKYANHLNESARILGETQSVDEDHKAIIEDAQKSLEAAKREIRDQEKPRESIEPARNPRDRLGIGDVLGVAVRWADSHSWAIASLLLLVVCWLLLRPILHRAMPIRRNSPDLQPEARGSSSAVASQEKIRRLCDFLRSAFRPEELNNFLRLKGFATVAEVVNREIAGAAYFLDVVQVLHHRNLIDAKFFDHLTTERPAKTAQIESLKESWLDEHRAGTKPSGGPTTGGTREVVPAESATSRHQLSITPSQGDTETLSNPESVSPGPDSPALTRAKVAFRCSSCDMSWTGLGKTSPCPGCGEIVFAQSHDIQASGTKAKEVMSVRLEASHIPEKSGCDPVGGSESMNQQVAIIGTPTKMILFLGSNPKNSTPLRLGEEVRKIEQGLERSKRRDQFKMVQKWAVTGDDLRRALLDHEPEIVHFAGHCTGAGQGDLRRDMVIAGGRDQGGLAFEDDAGQVQQIPGEFLARLFELCADHVKCVVLNACSSEDQADAIARHIDYVIGMKSDIEDEVAIKFAVGFYDALGAGKDYERAFKFGCSAIELKGVPEHLTPVLKKKPLPGHPPGLDSNV
jgi:HEAT repeat protein